MIKIEKKSPKTNDEEFLDLDIINNNLSEFINEATFLQDYSIDMYRDFVEIERYIKTNNKEAKNSVNDIKKFFERVSKDSFYLGGILKDTFSTINKLAIDEVSCLKIRKLLYHYIARLMLLKEKTKEKTNPTINDVEIFRFGGDEFIAVISRGYGIEVAFFDLMYLNYFNELMGYRGGDSAIFNICNTIEKTFKSYIGKTTKTKDIIAVSYTHLTLPTICSVQISVVAVSLKKKKKIKTQITTTQATTRCQRKHQYNIDKNREKNEENINRQ
eukprot:TRINITY_DN12447_c0_g1_i1.p1 TRINITY_DN12447_c0_g1~~TRINITY_DN12447_c0_g1_i1.p1  ORF type:complete len:272 (-),score=41.27 TRINITY_DN12447_c0_g1_i1:13-828(-)